MEENKGRNLDLRPSESGRRSNERTGSRREPESRSSAEMRLRGNEYSGSKRNEAGRINDHRDYDEDIGDNPHQQRLRDVEIPRRSHETESRFWHRQRDRSADRRGDSESRRRLDERSQPQVQSNNRRVEDCRHFVRTGQCRYGERCFYNHPSHIPQATTADRRASEYEGRLHERAESRSRAENRGIAITDYREPDSRRMEVGFERVRREQIEEREARRNVREQRRRDNMERQRREVLRQQRLREMRDQEGESQRDVERERRDARSSLDQVEPTVEFNDLSRMRGSLRDLGFERKEGDGF